MKIHGQTEIVLKNVKTGLVERVRSENVFQGGIIAEHFRSLGINAESAFPIPSNADTYPMWKTAVGGLFLFRDQIEEGTRFMPAGNIMVGAGVSNFTHSGAPSEWGSFNAVESSSGLAGITQVYDFTTDQANGEIGCACLTSRRGAQIGYGNSGNYVLDNYDPAYYINAIYNSDAMRGYSFKDSDGINWELQTYNADSGSSYSNRLYQGKLWITKKRAGIDKVGVFDSFYKVLEFDLTQIGTNPFNLSSSSTTSGNYEMFPIGGAKFAIAISGEVVYSAGKRYVANNETVYWYELDADAETLTQKSFTNITGERLAYAASNGGTSCAFTEDGCAIMYSDTSAYNYYKIRVSDGYIIKNFGPAASGVRFQGSYQSPAYGYGQTIAPGLQVFDAGYNTANKGSTSYALIYDTVNDTLKFMNCAVSTWQGRRNTMHNALEKNYYGGYSSAFKMIPHPLYLATINNIQPVTKTAAQTMKVTYTLQEV